MEKYIITYSKWHGYVRGDEGVGGWEHGIVQLFKTNTEALSFYYSLDKNYANVRIAKIIPSSELTNP